MDKVCILSRYEVLFLQNLYFVSSLLLSGSVVVEISRRSVVIDLMKKEILEDILRNLSPHMLNIKMTFLKKCDEPRWKITKRFTGRLSFQGAL